MPIPAPETRPAPFGIERLRRIPRVVYLATFVLGAASLLASTRLQGAARGGALLLGLVLLDFGAAGLRFAWVPSMRGRATSLVHRRARGILLVAVVAGAVAYAGYLFFLQRQKAAILGRAHLVATASLRETSGVDHVDDLVYLPHPLSTPENSAPPLDVAVYSGTRRLAASALVDRDVRQLIVETSLRARQTLQLEVYFGVTPQTDGLDPEVHWDLGRAYRRGIQSFDWKATDDTGKERVPPFAGAKSLRLEIEPTPGLASPFLWADVPVPAPRTVSAETQLLYAIRSLGSPILEGGVAVRTDRGHSWEHAEPDQAGRPTDLQSRIGESARDRWCLRRVPLGRLAGAHIQAVGIIVYSPSVAIAATGSTILYLDGIRIVAGQAVEGEIAAAATRD